MQRNKEKFIRILGERIRQLRLQKSKSLNSFVFNNSTLTTATWSRIENGLVDMKYTTLIQVASALDITLYDLFKDIDIDYKSYDE